MFKLTEQTHGAERVSPMRKRGGRINAGGEIPTASVRGSRRAAVNAGLVAGNDDPGQVQLA
eukprot:4972795-Lingulodinium_polyedra.AAC.1